MAATYRFVVPVPAVGQVSAVYARLYQAATLNGAYAQVGTDQLIADLTPVAGLYTWIVAVANPALYSRLVLVSSDGVEGQAAQMSPAATPGYVNLEVYSEDVVGTVQADLRFQADPIKGHASSGTKTICNRAYVQTDAAGYAVLPMYADSGMYKITLDGQVVAPQFDTTGLSGTTVNLADILA